MARQQWAVSADGGFLANPPLSKQLRKATQPMMKFRQFVRTEPGFGKNKGDTLDFDKVSNVQTQGGRLTEAVKIPETKFQIVKDSLIIDEYGNSIPYTGKLEMLSEFDIQNPVQRALRDDMVKVIDINVALEFKDTNTKYIPTGLASGTFDNDGTPSTTATANLAIFHVKEMVDAFKTGEFGSEVFNPVMPFTGPEGDYIMIASVKAARGIKDDPEFEEWLKYTSPDRLINGEVGRIYGVRVVESNHTSALSNGTGSANVLGEAVLFGEDPVMEGIATPEELRAKIPQDFGRDKGIAWYALLGWKITWKHLATDTIPESHIFHITSQ